MGENLDVILGADCLPPPSFKDMFFLIRLSIHPQPSQHHRLRCFHGTNNVQSRYFFGILLGQFRPAIR